MKKEHFEHDDHKCENQEEINKPFDPENVHDEDATKSRVQPARTGEPDPGH